MLGLFLLGILSRRASPVSGLIAIVIGVVVIGWLTLSPENDALPEMLRNPLHTNLTIVVGTMTIFLAGLCISRLVNPNGPPNSDPTSPKLIETESQDD